MIVSSLQSVMTIIMLWLSGDTFNGTKLQLATGFKRPTRHISHLLLNTHKLPRSLVSFKSIFVNSQKLFVTLCDLVSTS